ncbi:sugar phosphate isomerase/epimerase [Oscillospiraceae bacterium MB08-C2-2]|nr:sugar phosphate isomerase/epimerase [Oscillospiraceae bacterium MB08-C2-2]
MLPGVSTACLYPQELESALRKLANISVKATEVFINSFSELEEPFLKRLRSIADSGGTQVLSVHPFTCGLEPMLFFSGYDRRLEDGREFYKKYYQAACILGAKLVMFHGNYRTTPIPREKYFSRYQLLMEDAAAFGVELCHENVSRCAGYDPSFFSEMKKCLPDAGFVLDLKQCIRSGVAFPDMISAMGDGVRHIHISDHDQNHDCMLLGRGQLDLPNFIDSVAKNGFDGGIIVELYRENFGDFVEIKQCYQHLFNHLSI